MFGVAEYVVLSRIRHILDRLGKQKDEEIHADTVSRETDKTILTETISATHDDWDLDRLQCDQTSFVERNVIRKLLN